MRAVIVDDELYSRNYVERLCLDIPGLRVVGSFADAETALEYMILNKPDVVFMDVEMPGLTGMEAVQIIRDAGLETGVIFITGYEQYALEAFRADAVAYLLKPCSLEEMQKAVQKAVKLAPKKKKRVEIVTFGYFAVAVDGIPLRFSNNKARELLALLIDSQGRVVKMEQAVDILWEDRPYDEQVKRLYRKAVAYLKQVFDEKNLDFFVTNRGSCHVIPSKVDCDYFDLLQKKEGALEKFNGEYLNDYSWGEETVAKINHFLKKI